MVTVLRAFATTHEAGAVAITFSEMEKKKKKETRKGSNSPESRNH